MSEHPELSSPPELIKKWFEMRFGGIAVELRKPFKTCCILIIQNNPRVILDPQEGLTLYLMGTLFKHGMVTSDFAAL